MRKFRLALGSRCGRDGNRRSVRRHRLERSGTQTPRHRRRLHVARSRRREPQGQCHGLCRADCPASPAQRTSSRCRASRGRFATCPRQPRQAPTTGKLEVSRGPRALGHLAKRPHGSAPDEGRQWPDAFADPELRRRSRRICGCLPPDTDGDVGPNHYMQWVNTHFAIYTKTGTQVGVTLPGNALWAGNPNAPICPRQQRRRPDRALRPVLGPLVRLAVRVPELPETGPSTSASRSRAPTTRPGPGAATSTWCPRPS